MLACYNRTMTQTVNMQGSDVCYNRIMTRTVNMQGSDVCYNRIMTQTVNIQGSDACFSQYVNDTLWQLKDGVVNTHFLKSQRKFYSSLLCNFRIWNAHDKSKTNFRHLKDDAFGDFIVLCFFLWDRHDKSSCLISSPKKI